MDTLSTPSASTRMDAASDSSESTATLVRQSLRSPNTDTNAGELAGEGALRNEARRPPAESSWPSPDHLMDPNDKIRRNTDFRKAEHPYNFAPSRLAGDRSMTASSGESQSHGYGDTDVENNRARGASYSNDCCASLTPRQREVCHWICEGKRDREIATILGISYRTVTVHVRAILKKLGVENRTSAARMVRGVSEE